MEPDRWLGVEIRHLAALQAVAIEGSFGRAAERLGYTQSAVSQQIATLERIVGGRLVERPGGPRPVSLTEAGALLLRHAEAITARLRAARADLDALAAGTAGRLRIGVFQSVGARILPEVMRRYPASWPRVEVSLTETNRDSDLVAAVERGELDLAFSPLPIDEGPIESVELLHDPWLVLARADSHLCDGEGLVLAEDLAGVPLIGFHACRSVHQIEGELRARGIEPNVVFRSDDNGTVHGLVAAGVGVALVPALAAEPNDDVVALELGMDFPPRTVVLAWHRDRYLSPAAIAFIDTARDVCTDLADALAVTATARPGELVSE
jgi:DNA-binding transcriptional LysR family regulator